MLHVVTSAAWLAADFAAAGVLTRHHLGLEAFPVRPGDGIGCSGGFAALDDTLLAALPQALTGRRVAVGTPDDLAKHFGAGPVFVKLAGVKDSARPARLYPGLEQAREALAHAGAPVEHLGPLLASQPLLLAEEYRVLVADDAVVDAAIHLDSQGRTAHDAVEAGHRMAALAFAGEVVRTVPPALVPSVWILDVARTTGGTWVPVEANPVWSSNTYGLDLAAVASAIRRSGSTPRDTALPWRLPAHWANRARPLPAGAAA